MAWPFPTGQNAKANDNIGGVVKGGANYAPPKTERKVWDTSSLVKFANLIAADTPVADIAKALDRTVKAVTNQISDAKLKKTVTGRQLATFIANAQAQLAKAKKPANHKAAWDAKADNQLLIAFAKGGTVETVAAECSRTVASVAGRLRELGVLEFKREQRPDGDFDIIWTVPARVWYQTVVKA
jgi:hypothetical protein